MPGVAGELHEVQVEGTFPDGTKLVTIADPICREDGDLAIALKVAVKDLSSISADVPEARD